MDFDRRQFLKSGMLGAVAAAPPYGASTTTSLVPSLRIALLHLAPIPANILYNRQLIVTATTTAAGLKADWLLTPELCVCGSSFFDQICTDWILPQPDPWIRGIARLASRWRVTVFLSHPERDQRTGNGNNALATPGYL